MTQQPPKKLVGWRELFYLGVALCGIALVSDSGFSLILVSIYVVLLFMALIAELLGR